MKKSLAAHWMEGQIQPSPRDSARIQVVFATAERRFGI
jgi:hypothetical protein